MTANQLVAYNVRLARQEAGLTQVQASQLVAHALGRPPWSKASWSAAESSVKGKRIKAFDADEIKALAEVFEKPVGWFFRQPGSRLQPRPSTPNDAAGAILDELRALREEQRLGLHLIAAPLNQLLAAELDAKEVISE